MPLVTMPDGQEVMMPDNPTPDQLARLRSLQTPAAPAPRSLTQTGVESFQGLNPLRQVAGIGEAALQMGSGMASQALGGVHALGTLATGGGLDAATKNIRDWEEKGTYQPRLEQGKAASQLAALPLEKLSEGTGWVGEQAGGDAGRAIGEVAPAMAATVLGGAGALRAAPKMPVRPALEKTIAATKAKLTGEPVAPTAAQVAESRLNAPQIEAANLAKKYGIAIDPTTVSKKSHAKVAFAGETNLAEALNKANSGRWEIPLKRELGMAEDAPISMDAIKAVREKAAIPSEEIATLGQFVPDKTVIANINALRTDPLIGGEAAGRIQSRLVEGALTGIEKGMDAQQVLSNISGLRKRARDIYKMADAGPERLATADTSLGIANALEGMVEGNLQTLGKGDLLGQYRKGRQDMAKSYVLEDVTNLNTGRINPSDLAKMTSKDSALTGAFKDVGQIVGVFPETIGKSTTNNAGTYGARRVVQAALPRVAGAALGAFTNVPRTWAARRVASPKYQAKNNVPQDFRPMRERLGYGEVAPEPVPLSAEGSWEAPAPAPAGPTIQPRPTLELAPMDANVGALRNKGAKIPLGPEPVEFTPGATQDFMLRQEKLHGYESATLKYLREKVADLEAKRDNASGFWKNRYAKEIETMKPILEEEKAKYDITDAASEHGLRRKLYESGGPTALPIVKTLRRK